MKTWWAKPLVLAWLAAGPAAAQTPAGLEVQVNTYTTDGQVAASVAIDGSGNFVVVWWTEDAPTHVRGQRFDRLGTPRGSEFLVAAGTGLNVGPPELAGDAAGGFTVVWSDRPGQAETDVMARRYDASGAPAGAEFRVNTYTTGYQFPGSIASEASGAFVVVWTGTGSQDGDGAGIFGQRFDAGGNRLGVEFTINSNTTGNQHAPTLAMDGAGNFVVVWRSALQGYKGAVLAGQRFTRDGLKVGSEFQVKGALGVPHYPALAVAPGGEFLVAWADSTELPTRLLARRYDAAGVPRGPEFLAHVFATNGNFRTAVAADGAGRMTVMWSDVAESPSDGRDIEARRFDASGAPRGREFRSTTRRTGNQAFPGVKADAVGNLVIAWTDGSLDSTEIDVYAQRARALTPHALSVDPVPGAGSDGNGVLEPGEMVEVRTAWHNHSGGAVSLAGALSGISGPRRGTYRVIDGAGSYGMVADAATQACLDCYAVRVSAATERPVAHWDAVASEALNGGDDGHQEWLLHVGASFPDVPRSSPFYRFVETLLHLRVTAGCGAGAYCPGAPTTREQMAVFLLTAKEVEGYRPPACTTPVYGDVPATSPYCRWIEELRRRGITGGCGIGIYCPGDPVSREQMAAFVLLTLDPTATPPDCTTPIFNDVPASSPFCRWIEELVRRGVVGGCAPGLYCPTLPVTRDQMAVFLTGTFGLTLYGP